MQEWTTVPLGHFRLLQSGMPAYARLMALNATKRRWLGVLVLGLALAMVIAGQTVLRQRLRGLVFAVYWLVCFVLTCTAAFIALADARALRQQTRRETRDLFESTLRDIETDARLRQTDHDRTVRGNGARDGKGGGLR